MHAHDSAPDTAAPTPTPQIERLPPASLRPNPRNARTHSKAQIRKIAASLRAFGFVTPIVVDEALTVLAGHGRLEAARLEGLPLVPVVRLDHLTDAQKRAYVLADNKIAEQAGWDREMLTVELWRGRVDYPALKAMVQRLAAEWQPRRVLIEDASAGTSLIQELRRSIPGLVGVRPERDKVTRMAVASAKIEAGQVLLPERAPWLAELEAELFAFPGGRHDDECDAISQALNDSHNSALLWAATDWPAVLAKVSVPRRVPY